MPTGLRDGRVRLIKRETPSNTYYKYTMVTHNSHLLLEAAFTLLPVVRTTRYSHFFELFALLQLYLFGQMKTKEKHTTNKLKKLITRIIYIFR